MIRVLRLWRWWDILRRTRPIRVYPYCVRHVSRTNRLPLVCTPTVRCLRDEGDRTRRPCRAADVGSSTIGVPD